MGDDERQYGITSALQHVIDDRIISTGLWPPRSPDLSVCDFHLWGNLKVRAYRNTTSTVEALQNKIRNVIASISTDEF